MHPVKNPDFFFVFSINCYFWKLFMKSVEKEEHDIWIKYEYTKTHRVFIKYYVLSLKFCDFSELCQLCCSADILPAF